MRLHISGEYPAGWAELSLQVRREAGWRCIRCFHPFASPALAELGENDGGVILVPQQLSVGAPLFCDAECDLERGIHRRVHADCIGERQLTPGNSQWLKVLNYGVHHLDGDKSNCRWWNLLALCNSCHLKIQSKVIPERAWLFEHSDWFKPYAAGFYAHWFARAETLRAGVEADLEYFLAMGQPWLYAERAS